MTETLIRNHLREVSVFSLQRRPVNGLSGYRKTHRISTDAQELQRYLAQIGNRDLEREMDRTYQRLRQLFAYRRRQLQTTGPAQGVCLVTTPDFELEISLTPDFEDSEYCIMRRMVGNVRQTDLLLGSSLDQLLEIPVHGLQIPLGDEMDLESLIDHVEDQNADGLQVEYDRDATWCELSFADSSVRVRIQGTQLTASPTIGGTTLDLVTAWADFQRRLLPLMPHASDQSPDGSG